ncbi:hypothetical protein EIP91_012340 [Steccherinum ochraceum]|uniref:C2H2-type domain-containing protein n=1 Tax=Steccherinum ochraceum TaxID=92696 RepID=A0A4R0RQ47_9APHY|nr:hypothetical protein EIP91_012340 [Steccherinum ochraceum]
MAYCTRCKRSFASEQGLQHHKETSKAHSFCRACNRHFVSDEALAQHYRGSPRHHYCDPCEEHFDDEDDLERHDIDVHNYCAPCNIFFSSACALENHDIAEHNYCSPCCRYFSSHAALKQHDADVHHYCTLCSKSFKSIQALGQHDESVHNGYYCAPCKRTFQTQQNLDTHLRSSNHQPRRFKCPGRKCTGAFVSSSGLIAHCESGACPSGVSRQAVDRLVVALDRNNVITNPARLLAGPAGFYAPPLLTSSWATAKSWNGDAYECVVCHREFRSLNALNSHLQSPVHQERIYRCPTGKPGNGCGTEFKTLSGLVQHVESGVCGVKRFQRQIDSVVEAVTGAMLRLAF